MAVVSRGRSGRGGRVRADVADDACTRRTGGWADGAERARTVERTDGRGRGGADGAQQARTGGQAGGPGFKRPHSTRPVSLLGAQSACLVRARVRRVLGSAVGSSRIPRQIPVLSARIHLPHLSASVLGAEKGILLSAIRK